jgi:hypothetical protein
MKLTEDSKMGEIWREMSPAQQEKLFFFLLEIVQFYGSGDTWFAVALLPDPPAGLIMGDHQGRKPGSPTHVSTTITWPLTAV